ncbi:nucleoside phosphorylase domain-containing protein [Aspergillus heterothallicus]
MCIRIMLSHSDYRIGWICALSIELAAAEAMLDRIHECLPNRVEDDNTYTYGEIGKHNIVIACLPAGVYGTNSAASVAVQMRSSFPSLRFCLLVGIAGGAPTFKTDIRLGDVVVSKPTPKYAGVIQYDYGKALNGQFISTGALDKPPPVLLKAIARLEATHHLYGNKIAETRAEVFEIWGQRSEVFFAPEEYADKLFISTYDHVDENRDTCDACDLSMLRPRIARSSNEPRIFYGLIASANQVLRNAVKRDLLSHQHDILCFEMEAAGLMDVLPCLVIRGICDYSDSHKNKNWQGCAALNAAAYARELVSVIPFHEVNCTPVVNSSVPHLADSNLVEFSGQPQQSLLTAPSSAPNDSYFDCTNEYEGQLTPLEGFASPLGPLHFYCEDDHGLAFLEDSLQDHDQAESSVLSDVKDLDRPYARFDNGSRAAVTADNLANAQSDDANFPVHSGTQDEYRSTLNTFPNPTEQFGQEPNTGSYGIVNIGIDIGTRYTRVAYGFPGGLNFGIHKWPHFNRRTARVPTEVSWDGQEYSWGYGSRLEAASTPWLWAILRMRNDFEQWMADVGISAPDPPHSPRFPEGEEASYALSHYLSSLWNHITDTLQRRHGHLIHASLTWHVVFALPDVWVDIAQVVFFDAVKISRIPDRTRLSLIKHNTGAVQAAVYDIFSRVRTNEAYIVCSAGSNIIHAVTYTRSRSNNVTMKRRYRHSCES